MTTIKQVSQLSEIGVGALNEDRVLVNKKSSIFGVFDGVSSLNKYITKDSKTGGYTAATIAADTFNNSEKDLASTALEATQNIEDNHKAEGIEVKSSLDRFGTTAAVIKVRNNTAELLQVADSIVIVIYKDGRVEVPLGYHDHDLEVMHKLRKLANNGIIALRDSVANDVIELRHNANVTYGVINGDKRVKDFIKTTTIELTDVKTIIMITDGMFLPKEDPDIHEDWDEYARLYQGGGLQKMYSTVRALELSDPELTRYPRYKLHDDASAVAIDFA